MILRRRDCVRIAAAAGQRREAHRLIAVFFVDAEKPQWRGGEQPVDAGLNVRAHVTREHPRGRNQPVRRNAGKVRAYRVTGLIELPVADDVRHEVRDLADALIADKRQIALQ
jgi:hypothetical protein